MPVTDLLEVTRMRVWHSVVIENMLRLKIRIQSFHRYYSEKNKTESDNSALLS